MPITATAAVGKINVALEATPGEQILLAATPLIATMTLTTQPTGVSGQKLHLRLTNWTAAGSFTVTGTGLPANTETYNFPAPTAQQTQSAQLASFDLVTVNAYTAVTNITSTGGTNGTLVVTGIQSGKYPLPGLMVSSSDPKTYSANEHNGLIERDKVLLHLTKAGTFDLKQDVYADLSLWWPYMAMGAPTTTTTLPATPTSLFAATALTSSQTLTTNPTAPGMKLIITITSFTVAGTLTINGTVNGIPNTTETISITAAGTYYSSYVYQSATVTITNATTAATMAVTGIYGWSYTFLSGQPLYSAALEWFDGVGSWIHPFCIAQEGDFDIKVQTESTLTLKGKCQDKYAIGDRTTVPLTGVSRVAALGVNLQDQPLVGWQTAAYLDPITGTPFTTPYTAVQEFKVSYKIPQEDHFTFTNSQTFNRAYPVKREFLCEAMIDFTDMLQYEQFRQNLKQYLAVQFIGKYIGSTGGAPQFKSWTWTLPIKTDGKFDVTSDPSKGNVRAKAMWRTEYDSGIGGAVKLVVVSTQPPNFAA